MNAISPKMNSMRIIALFKQIIIIAIGKQENKFQFILPITYFYNLNN